VVTSILETAVSNAGLDAGVGREIQRPCSIEKCPPEKDKERYRKCYRLTRKILRMMIGSQLANQEIRTELLATVTAWLEGKEIESVNLWDTDDNCLYSTSSPYETAHYCWVFSRENSAFNLPEFIYPWEVENPQIFVS
jgi:hypothetical protein